MASKTGNVVKYGGYFQAKGQQGRAVYGYASDTGNGKKYGGYFVGNGTNGYGVLGKGGKYGVYGQGGDFDFYAASGSGGYGPFTGAHDVRLDPEMSTEIRPGMIVVVTGKAVIREDENGEICYSSTLPTVTLAAKARDKAVFGVLIKEQTLPEDHWYKSGSGERFGIVNALGEGVVWVSNLNSEIMAGDYITTSPLAGYGQLQEDDILHSYTLGKATEDLDWEAVEKSVIYRGRQIKISPITVVYTSG
jgi:hypothetical protein